MRLVRLERQQSRVADDVRAALASLGRGSTVIGGIALIGVGTVTDRPIEAVVLLPHGVIIVIGVDLPDPALRLEAPLGAEWRADGWPLVADDDAVNPATEALDLSQACESRIVELVPGTAPVGTIVAVGPYVETVDQPASDLAGPVRVLHPTPTTMLAATVSLATAHRPRSVDQVRALIRGLAPDAPEFSDEVLLGEGFSRFSDDTPPESLWDTGPRVPSQVSGTPTRGLADWRTATPSASGRTQTAGPATGPDSHPGSGSAEALGIPKGPDSASPADSAMAVTSETILDTATATGTANSAPAHPEAAAAVAPDTASDRKKATKSPPVPTPAAAPETTEPELPAESASSAAPIAAATLGSTQPAELGPPQTPASSPETTDSAEHSVPAGSPPAAPDTTAAPVGTKPAEPAAPRTPAESAPAVAPNTTAAAGTTKPAEPTAPRTPAESTPDTTAASVGTKPAEPTPPRTPAEPTPDTTAAPVGTKPAEPTPPRTPAESAPAAAADTTAATANTNPTEPAPPQTPAESVPAVASNTAAVLRATKPADSGPARTSAGGMAAAVNSVSDAAKSTGPEIPGFADSERTETLGKPAAVLPLFPGAEQIPPYRPTVENSDPERTETLPHPGPPRPAAAPLPPQETPVFPHSRSDPAPRPVPAPAAPTSRTVRWLPLGAIGLLVALVVAAVVVATSGDDTPPAPATQVSQPPAPQPTKAAPAESLQFSLRAADGDQRCASHAFGDAQASLQQTSCSGVRRASYATTVDGRAGAVTIGIVAFPDAAQAAAFKAITDTPGGGGILDLAAETGKWSGPAPKFENAAYTSKLEGTSVRVVQAVWVPGPSTPDDPGLARAAKAALDLPAR
ncbi:hypothetical protein ACGFMK_33320 [Amycolatopsis sp. NPDC049252]|uniref:hypothetical protein n=1 Tax=Amycolatopsis sp. NPDC049252 TaxID=3363933 RepID=UPI003714AADD